MRTYEVLFILSPQVPEEEVTALVTEFRRVGETTGARLAHEDAWGRRRLAYPIQKFTEGNYHLFVFESEGSLAELDRRMKNSDRVLRHMIVRTDLDHKRAEKLAKRNPKKERVRPAPAFTPAEAPSEAPIRSEAVPVRSEAVPVRGEAAPVRSEAAPVRGETAPVE